MLGYLFLLSTVLVSAVIADDGVVEVSDDKKQCLAQMVEWCKGMKYPQEGAGMSMVSISYHDQTGHYRVFCSSDSEGTNCTRNRVAWFACSPDNKFSYKGSPVTEDSDVDDDMCKTADKAFNDLFVQSMSYDNATLKTELERGMEGFFQQMASMQEQIQQIQKTLRGVPFYERNFWNMFEENFSLGSRNASDSESSESKKESNQIEKE